MMPPVILLNYHALLPWWLMPLPWMVGVVCLWFTRKGSTLGARWPGYFTASAIMRPLGILLIGYAWMELLAVPRLPEWTAPALTFLVLLWPAYALGALLVTRSALPLFMVAVIAALSVPLMPGIYLIFLAIFWLAFCFSGWAVFQLGLRQSFFYRKPGDPLVMSGPYAVVRHPQLLAAALMAASSAWVFNPRDGGLNTWALANAFALGWALWLMILAEERDLARELGERFAAYAREVPRFIPRLDRRVWRVHCPACGAESPGKLKACPACGNDKKLKTFARPQAATGCLLPVAIPAMLLLFGGIWINTRTRAVSVQQRHPRGMEARRNLQQIKYAQQQYQAETGHFATDFATIGWENENWNAYYVFCMGADVQLPQRQSKMLLDRYGELEKSAREICAEHSGASAAGFTALAVGDLDGDPALDVWVTNDSGRTERVRNDWQREDDGPLSAEDLLKTE